MTFLGFIPPLSHSFQDTWSDVRVDCHDPRINRNHDLFAIQSLARVGVVNVADWPEPQPFNSPWWNKQIR